MTNYRVSLTKTAAKQLDKLDDNIAKPIIDKNTGQATAGNCYSLGHRKDIYG